MSPEKGKPKALNVVVRQLAPGAATIQSLEFGDEEMSLTKEDLLKIRSLLNTVVTVYFLQQV